MMGGYDHIISARVDELDLVKAAIKGGAQKIVFGGDRLYRAPYPMDIYKEVVDYCHSHKVWVSFATPRVIKDQEGADYHETLAAMVEAQPDAIAIHAPGYIVSLKDLGYQGALEGDTSLNIFNSHTAEFWAQQGFASLAPSQELTLSQLSKMARNLAIPLEATAHGLVEMNSHMLDMRSYVPDLIKRGIGILRIDGRQWNPKELQAMVAHYKAIMLGLEEAPPKKEEDGRPITRGHYFRGIL